MNRRDFVLGSTLAAAAGLIARPLLGQNPAAGGPPKAPPVSPTAPATEFRTLRGDVGLFTGRGGTMGWLVNREGIAVVDTQFAETASIFLAGLPGRAGRSIDVVVNTHHHGDHVSGNPVFKPVARAIVAHVNVPKLQFNAAEKAGTLDKQVYADTAFSDTWKCELGREVIRARYHGAAHTAGDIIVHFESANVVHMGDLVFNRLYPVTDRPGGVNIRGWISRLEETVKNYPADALYIFGHANAKFGATGGHGDLLVFRDYLSALLAHVEKAIADGQNRDQVVALTNLPGFPDYHVQPPSPSRLPSNLGAAFDELTEKKG